MPVSRLDNDDWLGDIGLASDDEALETKQQNPLNTPVDTAEKLAEKLNDNIDAELTPFLEIRKRLLRFQTLLQVSAVLLYTIGTALFVDGSDTSVVTPAVTNTTN